MTTVQKSTFKLEKALKLGAGIYRRSEGVTYEIIEPQALKQHQHIRGGYPERYPVESSFETGPVLLYAVADGVVDVAAGIGLSGNGQVIRESAVTLKLIDRYVTDWAGRSLDDAATFGPGHIIPLATQRTGNFCRWWLDSISKIFLAERSVLVRELGADSTGPAPATFLLPELSSKFQQSSIRALATHLPQARMVPSGQERIRRGNYINAPGLTYGGGQRLGALVRDYGSYLRACFASLIEQRQGPRLLYLSRNESDMRRIVNEDQLLPRLRELGFEIIVASEYEVLDQIGMFGRADLIVGAHGAGLTNIIFSKPGAALVEIFPEGGVHGSAFLRIASHCQMPYYYFVGDCVPNRRTQKNPNNSDIRVDCDSLLALLVEVMADLTPVSPR
jgi:capsular polysaccharide biosynthesis protein